MIRTDDLAVAISCDNLMVAPTAHSRSIVYSSSKMQCGVLWEGYTGNHIEAKPWTTHLQVPGRWLSVCAHYAFVQLGVAAVVVACSAQDHKTERALVRLGGVLEGVITEGMSDGAAMTIFTIRKDSSELLAKLIKRVPHEDSRL